MATMVSGPVESSAPSRALLAPRTTQYAIMGVLAGMVFPILASLIKVIELHLPVSLASLIFVQQTEAVIWITDTAPLFLGLVAGIAGQRQESVIQANDALRRREAELNSIHTQLEGDVLERTRELDERNAQMRSVVMFARQIADIQDVGAVLSASVEIIRERFGRYDVNLFLLDEGGQSAVLRASSSVEGRALVESGFRSSVGDQSVVGRVARRGKMFMSVLHADALNQQSRVSAGPATDSQIALPLMVRGRIIGVLDLHTHTPQPIGQSEAEILQLVADQLAASRSLPCGATQCNP